LVISKEKSSAMMSLLYLALYKYTGKICFSPVYAV